MSGLSWFCPFCRVALCKKGKEYSCAYCGFMIWERSGYFDASGSLTISFPKECRDNLASMEASHFWFGPRDLLIHSIIDRIVPSFGSIIELGCGTGRFISALKNPPNLVVAVDAFTESIRAAALKRKDAVLLRGDVCSVPLKGETFDVAVSMDVLEHVEPKPFLSEARRLVRPGGWFFLSAPSSSLLWSKVDIRAGHRCRYNLKMISEELKTNGWMIVGHTYYQCFLYPLMAASRLFLKGKSRTERHPPESINRLLGLINAFEVQVFSRFCLPWGSSIIVWARKI